MLLKISLPNASAMTLVKTRLVSTKSNWSSKVAFLSPIWFTSTLSARKESTFSYEHILTVKISVPNWKVACKISWCLYQSGFDKTNSRCIWQDILSNTNWRLTCKIMLNKLWKIIHSIGIMVESRVAWWLDHIGHE